MVLLPQSSSSTNPKFSFMLCTRTISHTQLYSTSTSWVPSPTLLVFLPAVVLRVASVCLKQILSASQGLRHHWQPTEWSRHIWLIGYEQELQGCSSHHFDSICSYLQQLFPGTPVLKHSPGNSIYSVGITDHHPWSAAMSCIQDRCSHLLHLTSNTKMEVIILVLSV